jgi:hypothetical protein
MSKPHSPFVERHCAKLRHELSAAKKSVPVDWFRSILVVGELGSHPKTRHLDALFSGQPGLHAGGSNMARVRRTVTMHVPRHITLARVESDTARDAPACGSTDGLPCACGQTASRGPIGRIARRHPSARRSPPHPVDSLEPEAGSTPPARASPCDTPAAPAGGTH